MAKKKTHDISPSMIQKIQFCRSGRFQWGNDIDINLMGKASFRKNGVSILDSKRVLSRLFNAKKSDHKNQR